MRYLLLFGLFSCLSSLLTGQDAGAEKMSEAGTSMSFDTENINFGLVRQGEIRDTSYTLINTGRTDIEIEIVSACVCTELDYSTAAIKPGEKSVISMKFDSTEKEESESVDVDVILKNLNEDGNQIMKFLSFEFELVKKT